MEADYTDTPQASVIVEGIYDGLRFFVHVFLPLFGTMYFLFSHLWVLPDVAAVLGWLLFVDALLGITIEFFITYSSTNKPKYDGSVNIHITPEGKKIFSLELDSDPDDLDTKKHIVFRVKTKHTQ